MSLTKTLAKKLGFSLLNYSVPPKSTHPLYQKGWGDITSFFNRNKTSDYIDNPKKTKEQLEAEYQSWVSVCINLITNRLCDLSFNVFVEGPDGSRKLNAELDGEIYNTIMKPLKKPNPQMPWRLFWQIVQLQWEIFGSSLIYKARNPLGVVTELYPLDVRFLKKITLDKSMRKGIKSFDFEGYGSFEPKNIIYLRYPDPFNFYKGRSKLNNLGATPSHDYFMDRFFSRFFKYDARPSMFIGYEGRVPIPKQRELINQWEERFSGNPFLPAILDEGAMIETVEMDLKKMDIQSLDRRVRDKVLTAWNVPISAIGLAEDVNRATAAALNPEFNTNAILPIVKLVQDFLTQDYLVAEFDPKEIYHFYFKYENPVPRDREEDDKKIKIYSPFMTLNEVRTYISTIDPEVSLPVLPDPGANILYSRGRPPEPLAQIPFDMTNTTDDPLPPMALPPEQLEQEPSDADRVNQPYGVNPLTVFSYYQACHKENKIKKYRLDAGLINLYEQIQVLEKDVTDQNWLDTVVLCGCVAAANSQKEDEVRETLLKDQQFVSDSISKIKVVLEKNNKDCTDLVTFLLKANLAIALTLESEPPQ